MEKINLVAVYGSLRSGMHNQYVLGQSKSLGTFNSEPIYTMYDVGGSYPAIIEKGCSSILMEIYEVNEEVKEKLDRLEGYSDSKNLVDNYYNKVVIETPYGQAYLYVFNSSVKNFDIVEIGDWVEYKKQIKKTVEWD